MLLWLSWWPRQTTSQIPRANFHFTWMESVHKEFRSSQTWWNHQYQQKSVHQSIFSRQSLEKGKMSHLQDSTFRLVYQWNQPITIHYFWRGLDPLTWWYHPDSCDVVKQHLPKYYPTTSQHTPTTTSSSSHLLRSLHTTYHSSTTQRCIPTFDDLEVLLQVFRHASHFCHIHSESIIRLDLDEVLTAQAQQTHGLSGATKFPWTRTSCLIDILFYTHPKKSNLIRDTGYRITEISQSWKVITDLHFHLFQCIMFSIYISMNHRDFLHTKLDAFSME